MLQFAGLGLLGFALWLYLGRAAEAAPVTPRAASQAQIADLVRRLAPEIGGNAPWADPAAIMAVIEIESSFDPMAYRAEPHLNDGSRGLMQILLLSARDRGFSGDPDQLYDPETNIRLGIAHLGWGYRYLASRLNRDPDVNEWIGAYNMGVGNVLKGNLPLGYVQKWRLAYGRWQQVLR